MVVAQHDRAYRAACWKIDEEARLFEKAQKMMPEDLAGKVAARPDGLLDFLSKRAQYGRVIVTPGGSTYLRGAAVWWSWAFDALLVLLPAVWIVIGSFRQTFCPTCGSWYRTVRTGPLDPETAEKIAELVGIEPPEIRAEIETETGEKRSEGRYQLSSCEGGCSPVRLRFRVGKTVQEVWLDPTRREAVCRLLDEGPREV